MRTLLLLLLALPSFAANRYWVGAAAGCDGTWADTDCWSATSNGAGAAGVPTAADDVFFDGVGNGASNSTLGANITINSLDMTGYANTLTHATSVVLTHDSSGVFKFSAGMTYSPSGTATITYTSTSGTTAITTAGKSVLRMTFNGSGGTFQLQDTLNIGTAGVLTRTAGTFSANSRSVVLSGSGAATIASAFTGTSAFFNLTRTGTAVKTDTFVLSGAIEVTGTLTIDGNSSVNRMLVASNTIGTSRTITAATVAVTNADFRDITGAGAGSWNLSAISGLSGDCGGNSGITLTTGATQYWVGSAGSWSTAAEWGTTSGGSGGRVPLPQDDVQFDANSFSAGSQTATMDMARMGKSIDFTGVTNNPTVNKSVTTDIYGSLTLVSGMTWTIGGGSTAFLGRGSHTLTSAGKTMLTLTASFDGTGTYTLQDALVSTGAVITFNNGTFNANGLNVTGVTLVFAAPATINLGAGTWTLTGTGNVWNANVSTTFNASTSTISITNTSATAKTFVGQSKTYNNVTFAGDNITVSGSNTFNTLAVNTAGYATGLLLTAGTTQTITSLTTNGSAGNLAKMFSTTTTNASLSKASGAVAVDYMHLTDITGAGGATWCAGANSTDGGDNTNWTFSACGGSVVPPVLNNPIFIQ